MDRDYRRTTLPIASTRSAIAMFVVLVGTATAQPPIHYFHNANLPPGTVAYGQLQRHMLMREYYQPVEVAVPQGANVSVNVGDRRTASRPFCKRAFASQAVRMRA